MFHKSIEKQFTCPTIICFHDKRSRKYPSFRIVVWKQCEIQYHNKTTLSHFSQACSPSDWLIYIIRNMVELSTYRKAFTGKYMRGYCRFYNFNCKVRNAIEPIEYLIKTFLRNDRFFLNDIKSWIIN